MELRENGGGGGGRGGKVVVVLTIHRNDAKTKVLKLPWEIG